MSIQIHKKVKVYPGNVKSMNTSVVKTENKVKTVIVTQAWAIDKSSLHLDHPIRSLEFSSQQSSNYKWSLLLFPKGKDDECEQFLSIFLHFSHPSNSGTYTDEFGKKFVVTPAKDSQKSVQAKIKFSILNKERQSIFEKMLTHTFEESNSAAGIKKFIPRDTVLNGNLLYSNSSLLLLCQIYIDQEGSSPLSTDSSYVIYEAFEHQSRLCDDFETLLESQNFSDVTLIAGGKKFYAHRNILASRSSIFHDFFSSETMGKEQNIIEITDLNEEVFTEVLRYIYAGKVRNLQDLAEGLLVAADKYQLCGLKATCQDILIKKITLDNVSNILIIAEQYGAASLKEKAIDYIISHSRQFIDTPGFQNITQSYPFLLGDIFKAVALKEK